MSQYTTAAPILHGGHSRCVKETVNKPAKRKRAEQPSQLDDARVAAPPPYGSGEPLHAAHATYAQPMRTATLVDIKRDADAGGMWSSEVSGHTTCTTLAAAPAPSVDVNVKVDVDALADATMDADLWMCGEHEGSPFSESDHGGSPFGEEFLPFES